MSFESRSWSLPAESYEQELYVNGGLQSKTSQVRSSDSGTVTRLSNNTPGYGLKKLTGHLPENTFRFTDTHTRVARGIHRSSYVSLGKTYYTKAWGIFGTPGAMSDPFSSSGILSNQLALAIGTLAGKVKDVDFDAAVFIGEGKETYQMFHSFAIALRSAAAAAKRGDSAGVMRALGIRGGTPDDLSKSAANAWLLLQYGVRPLINDITGALKALEKSLDSSRYMKAGTRNTYEDTIVKDFSSDGVYHKQFWTLKADTAARVKYRISNTQLASLSSYGLTNPLTVAWELTKLSFVVDWALRVGAWLSAFDAYLGKSFESGSTTQFLRTRCDGVYIRTKAPGYNYYFERRDYGWSSVSCKREQLTGFPYPTLPGYRFDPGLFHITTSLALLRQMR